MTATTVFESLRLDGGFTFDPASGTMLRVGSTTGWAIAVPGTERIVGRGDLDEEAFAEAFADVVLTYGPDLLAGRYVGGWYSPDRDVYLIELTDVLHIGRDAAIAIGRARGQEAVLDLASGEFVATGGSGDDQAPSSDHTRHDPA